VPAGLTVTAVGRSQHTSRDRYRAGQRLPPCPVVHRATLRKPLSQPDDSTPQLLRVGHERCHPARDALGPGHDQIQRLGGARPAGRPAQARQRPRVNRRPAATAVPGSAVATSSRSSFSAISCGTFRSSNIGVSGPLVAVVNGSMCLDSREFGCGGWPVRIARGSRAGTGMRSHVERKPGNPRRERLARRGFRPVSRAAPASLAAAVPAPGTARA
jgi:hypothetical protein